ncbi:hypothetical protein ABVT39_025462 [Epinephelus coioides]
MESLLVCLILLSVSGVWLEQPASALPASTVQVRVGENATLQCPLLDAFNASTTNASNTTAISAAYSTLSWYRKTAGQSPELLLTIRPADESNVKYGAGVGPDKVSAAANGSLLLHNSEQSDSAVYYCGITQGEDPKKKPNATGAH